MSERAPLLGFTFRVRGQGPSAAHASGLLGLLGASPRQGGRPADLVVETGPDPDPLDDWARCGGMWLTGEAGGPPQPAPGHQAAALRGAAVVARALAARLGATLDLEGPSLVGERAALLGLARRGTISPGGATRLLRAADRWLAVSLARRDDVDLVAAWLGHEWHGNPWDAIADALPSMTADAAVERAQILGIAAAVAVMPHEISPDPAPFVLHGRTGERAHDRPLVVDLSVLWAGPLCSRVLREAGARVVKVESIDRPDGTRAGPLLFFDLLHAGKESVALDFRTDVGRRALRELVEVADVVVEASRPRALEQLGVHADELLARRDGFTWVSITGYGRCGPWRERVAFGDDAAVAGGIAALTGEPDGPPLFCADAYADPVTGLHAAVGALASLAGGGSWLVDVAMRDVVSYLLRGVPEARGSARGRVVRDGVGWMVVAPDGRRVPVAPPTVRKARDRGPHLGEHTGAVLTELGISL